MRVEPRRRPRPSRPPHPAVSFYLHVTGTGRDGSFILEAEAMLKAALAERNRREHRDPSEADLLFLPYWDATHDQDLPGWVKRLRPRGGTAIVPEGLPPGPCPRRRRRQAGRAPTGRPPGHPPAPLRPDRQEDLHLR
jgi:hypothetical protein